MGGSWSMSIGYREIKRIDVEGYTRKICHISDVVLNSELDVSARQIDGNYFIYPIDNWQYGHVLQDVVGHYEFLKQHVPDLKLLILSANDGDFKSGNFITLSRVIDNIIESYPECVFINKNDKVIIKNLYCLFGFFMNPIHDIADLAVTNKPIHSDKDPDFNYQIFAAKAVAKKFGPKEPVKPTRKIYISRSYADTTYEDKFRSYYKRMRVLENSKLLEDYLASLGYEIVLNENLNIEEQAKLYQSASHVVTINGTGAYNTIFCNPGTTIFFLEIHTEFWWFFDLLTSEVTSNTVHKLPTIKPARVDEGRSVPVERLIECLKIYEDIL